MRSGLECLMIWPCLYQPGRGRAPPRRQCGGRCCPIGRSSPKPINSIERGIWGARCREARERREREEAPLALRATRPHTVGYIGVCDQEQGVIDSYQPGRGRAPPRRQCGGRCSPTPSRIRRKCYLYEETKCDLYEERKCDVNQENLTYTKKTCDVYKENV